MLHATEFHSLHATVYLFTYVVCIDIIHKTTPTPYIWRYRQWHAVAVWSGVSVRRRRCDRLRSAARRRSACSRVSQLRLWRSRSRCTDYNAIIWPYQRSMKQGRQCSNLYLIGRRRQGRCDRVFTLVTSACRSNIATFDTWTLIYRFVCFSIYFIADKLTTGRTRLFARCIL